MKMNNKVKIIIDSTVNVAENIKNRFTAVPLTVRFGEEEFIDGVTISNRQFYEKLIESDVIPTTSQATPDSFQKVFSETVRAGYDAVVITVSSKLSGTCQSASIAAAEYPDKIFVVDSNTVTIGSGILAELALRLADQGKSAEEIAETLEKEKANIHAIALLDTLEYLKRGGRISKTTAFAGTLLNIKPVISFSGGDIEVLGKARGSKQGNNLLVAEIEKAGGVDFTKPVLLGYTGLTDIMLQKYIEDSKTLWDSNIENLDIAPVGCVVGTHAGPHAIAVAFFKK